MNPFYSQDDILNIANLALNKRLERNLNEAISQYRGYKIRIFKTSQDSSPFQNSIFYQRSQRHPLILKMTVSRLQQMLESSKNELIQKSLLSEDTVITKDKLEKCTKKLTSISEKKYHSPRSYKEKKLVIKKLLIDTEESIEEQSLKDRNVKALQNKKILNEIQKEIFLDGEGRYNARPMEELVCNIVEKEDLVYLYISCNFEIEEIDKSSLAGYLSIKRTMIISKSDLEKDWSHQQNLEEITPSLTFLETRSDLCKSIEEAKQNLFNKLIQARKVGNLTLEEIDCLQILSGSDQKKSSPTSDQIRKVGQFLAKCIGNKELNEIIGILLETPPEGVDEELLKTIRTLTYKSENYRFISDFAGRLEKIKVGFESDKEIADEDKFSLIEYGKIKYMNAVTLLLDNYSTYIDSKSDFGKMYEDGKKMHQLIQWVNSQFQEEIKDNHQSGDIYVYHLTKSFDLIYEGNPSRLEKAQHTLFGEQGHFQTIVLNENGKFHLSEIWWSYEDEKLRPEEAAITRHSIRHQIDKYIISEEIKKQLVDKYVINNKDDKIDFNVYLQKSYQNAVQKIVNNNPYLKKIKNDSTLLINAGLVMLTSLIGNTYLIGGQKETGESIHEKFTTGKNLDEKMICSQYSMGLHVAALRELELMLQKDLKLENTEKLLKMPFNEKENWQKMNPVRAQDLLKDFIETYDPKTKVVHSLFKKKELI